MYFFIKKNVSTIKKNVNRKRNEYIDKISKKIIIELLYIYV